MAAEMEDGMVQELLDIYGDLNSEEAGKRLEAEADALYDDVLMGSVVDGELKQEEHQEDVKAAAECGALHHHSVYIGNFTWWMSDKDLINMAGKHGVKDIIKIKFAENRTNGLSKGYAKMVVSTEESLKRLLVSMPQCKISGEKVECRHVSQRTLAEFEAQARKRIPLRLTPKGDSERAEVQSSSTSCLSHLQAPPPPLMFPPAQPPPLIPTFYNTPPPPLPIPPFFNTPPPPFFHAPPPHTLIPNTQVQPLHTHSLHINPAFLPPIPVTQKNNNTTTTTTTNNNNNRRMGEAEFEELINRNRTIASSAITKSMSAATSGDIRMAIETLYTATAVIKQSRVFYDKRCRMLVESLNNCLNSIETKCFIKSKRSAERVRSRSRDRYRERSSSTDRERERGRDREHRDRR